MPGALSEVESTYFTLQSKIANLNDACQTPEQAAALSAQYVAAHDAFLAAQNGAFHDDDPEVATLTADLNDANTKLKKAVQEMGEIKGIIDIATEAVKISTSLAGKVIP